MKIGLLSREPNNFSTRRLRQACVKRGHQVKIFDTLKFTILVEPAEPDLFYQQKSISHYDAIIPRIGASITFFGAAVVRQFEQMGVYCLNSSHAISASRDKLRASQLFSKHQIGVPESAFVRYKPAVIHAIDHLGGAPVIIKLLEGTQGVGVILAESKKNAESIIETLQSTKQNVLIQKFVKESRGKDIRAIVVGDRVVAAMRRQAQGDEFRSNVHRGGKVEAIELDDTYRETALRAAQIVGLQVAGVDMLESDAGPMIMEVNSSPGLEGIESATGLNIADIIVEYLEQQVLFPEIDIRQRLTLKSGYGVVELPVLPESELIGKKIKDSGLREKDIVVLSIIRPNITIPNPKGIREILAGDRLLCFGNLQTLRNIMPARKPKKRKRKK